MHWLDEMQYRRMGRVGAAAIGVWPFDDLIQKTIQEHVVEVTGDKYRQSGDAKKDATTSIPGAGAVYVVLMANKYPAAVIPYVLAQTAWETAWYTSPAFQKDNNASGIMPFGSHKKGATKYAHFNKLNDWAIAMKSLISSNKGGAGAPINATSLQDYVHRLKANKYFTDTEAHYLQGLTGAAKKWQNMNIMQTKIKDAGLDPKKAPDKSDKSNWFKDHPIWTGALIATAAVIGIKAVS